MQPLTQELLEKVKQITFRAGDYIKQFYAKDVDIQLKADHTPVTEADLFVSQFLTQELKKLTPNIPVLSEECCNIPLAERAEWQQYWMIDPLDGTQQFINHTDQFSVVVALVQKVADKFETVLGIIHAPILGKTYFAIRGQGAFLQKNGEIRPLVWEKQEPTTHLKIVVGATSRIEPVRQALRAPFTAEIQTYGSSSLKAGLVAEGVFDAYVRLGDTGEWDTAVPELLMKELGGNIFDLYFQPLTYNQRESFINPHFVLINNRFSNFDKIFAFSNK